MYSKFGKKNFLIATSVGAIAVVALAAAFWPNEDTSIPEERLPGIRISNVGELSNSESLSLIGTVESVSEVKLESEASGRVTKVNSTLGQNIQAGTVIATLENSGQYASLLQAEGSYEAALAAAEISEVGVNNAKTSLSSAKQSAINANRAALNTWNSVLFNTVDELFSSPRSHTPGVRLSTEARVSFLNDERRAMTDILDKWQKEIARQSLTQSTEALQTDLTEAVVRVDRLREVVRVFIELLARQDENEIFTASELVRLQTEFTTAESSLNSTRASLQNSISSLTSAEEALTTAEIGGTSGEISSANASVKQALGGLRAAQANYNKTIISSPIGGTVNSLTIKAGDYISPGTFVANVANNNASVITTFVSVNDKERLAVGQEVTIDKDKEGTITAIASGLDPQTKKIKVEIQSDDSSLVNGDTVSLQITGIDTSLEEDTPIVIPVSALKVETNRILVFTVENDTLVAHEITEGPLQGTSITIEGGLTRDMKIVTDARGLNEGDKVQVIE